MQPNNDTPVPTPPQRGASIAPAPRAAEASHQAVANLTRQHIDQIYAKQDQTEHQESSQQSHSEPLRKGQPSGTIDLTNHLQKYHSAWQDYYQKYYQRYYAGAIQTIAQQNEAPADEPAKEGSIKKDEALNELHNELVQNIKKSAKKVRQSRHFVPAIAALCVLFAFMFLQYNSVVFAYAISYVSPGNIDPQNIIVDPNESLVVSKDPRLIIPKINVDITVHYNTKPDYDSQMEAMRTGVAYFGVPGASSKPGQKGNTPIAGHSSNDFTDTGSAKFIFSRLDQLTKGDTFYLNYQGIRYTYSVTKILIVQPNDTDKLNLGTAKAYATLITCTPLGTAEKRLLVIGEQISPVPDSAKVAPESSASTSNAPQMVGTSPTLLERLFGAN